MTNRQPASAFAAVAALPSEACSRSSSMLELDSAAQPLQRGTRVFVMLPLTLVDTDGTFKASALPWLSAALRQLGNSGVTGVAVDVWWGAVEAYPRHYRWTGYKQLLNLVKQSGLKVQVVLSFHACGGNVGDAARIPLPEWVLECGRADPDLFFMDRPRNGGLGHRNQEYISIWADDAQGVLQGRSPMQCYEDFMAAFRHAFDQELGDTIEEVVVGAGPCGELRLPSYVEAHGWQFPGAGEFQCYDRRALASLAQAARDAGHPEWGYAGPHDAGHYNSNPEGTGFFSANGSWDSPYGRFFLEWYSGSLLRHGDRLLNTAGQVFRGPPRPFCASGCLAGAMTPAGTPSASRRSSHCCLGTSPISPTAAAAGGLPPSRSGTVDRTLGLARFEACRWQSMQLPSPSVSYHGGGSGVFSAVPEFVVAGAGGSAAAAAGQPQYFGVASCVQSPFFARQSLGSLPCAPASPPTWTRAQQQVIARAAGLSVDVYPSASGDDPLQPPPQQQQQVLSAAALRARRLLSGGCISDWGSSSTNVAGLDASSAAVRHCYTVSRLSPSTSCASDLDGPPHQQQQPHQQATQLPPGWVSSNYDLAVGGPAAAANGNCGSSGAGGAGLATAPLPASALLHKVQSHRGAMMTNGYISYAAVSGMASQGQGGQQPVEVSRPASFCASYSMPRSTLVADASNGACGAVLRPTSGCVLPLSASSKRCCSFEAGGFGLPYVDVLDLMSGEAGESSGEYCYLAGRPPSQTGSGPVSGLLHPSDLIVVCGDAVGMPPVVPLPNAMSPSPPLPPCAEGDDGAAAADAAADLRSCSAGQLMLLASSSLETSSSDGEQLAAAAAGVAPAPAPLEGAAVAAAASAQRAVTLALKIAGIHWWYHSRSHAAELTAGYYNTDDHDGYAPIVEMCARHGAKLVLTCVEMHDGQHPAAARCGPEGLLWQLRTLAARAGVSLSGENALPVFFRDGANLPALERIIANSRARSLGGGSGASAAATASCPGSSPVSTTSSFSRGHFFGGGGGGARVECSGGSCNGHSGGGGSVEAAAAREAEARRQRLAEQQHAIMLRGRAISMGGNRLFGDAGQWLLRASGQVPAYCSQPCSPAVGEVQSVLGPRGSCGAMQQPRAAGRPPCSAAAAAVGGADTASGGAWPEALPALHSFTFLRLGPELLQSKNMGVWMDFMARLVAGGHQG